MTVQVVATSDGAPSTRWVELPAPGAGEVRVSVLCVRRQPDGLQEPRGAAARLPAVYQADTDLLCSLPVGDGDPAHAVGDERERDLHRFLGAHAVKRRVDTAGGDLMDALLEAGAISNGSAPKERTSSKLRSLAVATIRTSSRTTACCIRLTPVDDEAPCTRIVSPPRTPVTLSISAAVVHTSSRLADCAKARDRGLGRMSSIGDEDLRGIGAEDRIGDHLVANGETSVLRRGAKCGNDSGEPRLPQRSTTATCEQGTRWEAHRPCSSHDAAVGGRQGAYDRPRGASRRGAGTDAVISAKLRILLGYWISDAQSRSQSPHW